MTQLITSTSRFGLHPRTLRALMPAISLAVILLVIFYLRPNVLSYTGLNLLLRLAVPLALATLAQMFIITVNDLDLSIGAYVGLTAGISATLLQDEPILGIVALIGCVVAYGALGALIYWRNLPSIVVTLGMSFVWLGLAVILLPTPGGSAPDWLRSLMTLKPEFIPFPIIALVVIAGVVHVGLMWSPYGAVLRGVGGNAKAVERAGWSVLKAKVTMYALAGLAGAFAGMALLGISGAADARFALPYTLLTIAGVILGGGEFVGGRVSPIGAVIGAATLLLGTTSLLTFLKLNPDWQVGAQGAILIIVLALRVLVDRSGKR
jgi:ribose transport system permease protein